MYGFHAKVCFHSCDNNLSNIISTININLVPVNRKKNVWNEILLYRRARNFVYRLWCKYDHHAVFN